MLGTKNEKRIFQEKIVHMYLSIIKEENHLNENFWNEFFLLKANGGYLEQELLKLEHSEHRDRVLRVLFSKCSAVLENINQVKIINSLITLCSVTRFCLFQSRHTHQDDENDGKTNEYNRKWFEFFFADNDPQQSLEVFKKILMIVILLIGPCSID